MIGATSAGVIAWMFVPPLVSEPSKHADAGSSESYFVLESSELQLPGVFQIRNRYFYDEIMTGQMSAYEYFGKSDDPDRFRTSNIEYASYTIGPGGAEAFLARAAQSGGWQEEAPCEETSAPSMRLIVGGDGDVRFDPRGDIPPPMDASALDDEGDDRFGIYQIGVRESEDVFRIQALPMHFGGGEFIEGLPLAPYDEGLYIDIEGFQDDDRYLATTMTLRASGDAKIAFRHTVNNEIEILAVLENEQ